MKVDKVIEIQSPVLELSLPWQETRRNTRQAVHRQNLFFFLQNQTTRYSAACKGGRHYPPPLGRTSTWPTPNIITLCRQKETHIWSMIFTCTALHSVSTDRSEILCFMIFPSFHCIFFITDFTLHWFPLNPFFSLTFWRNVSHQTAQSLFSSSPFQSNCSML